MGIIRQISFSDIWHLDFKMIYYSIFRHIDYSKSFLYFNGSKIEASVLIGKRSLNDYFNNNIPKDRADFWFFESFEILSIKSSNNSSIEDIMDKVCDKMELGEILWAKPTVDISRNSLTRLNFWKTKNITFGYSKKELFKIKNYFIHTGSSAYILTDFTDSKYRTEFSVMLTILCPKVYYKHFL